MEKMLIFGAIALVLAIGIIKMLPDVIRYMKIRAM